MENEDFKMKRIILMYDFLKEKGGLENLMAIHANFLKENGYEVELLFGDIDILFLRNKMFKGLKIQEYDTFKKGGFLKILIGIFGLNNLKKLIKEDDLIISYSFPVNFTIRNYKNKKVFYMNHYPNFLYLPIKSRILWANNIDRKIVLIISIIGGWFLKVIDKLLMNKNKLIFVNSKFTFKKIKSIYQKEGVVSYPPVFREFKPKISKTIKKKYSIRGEYIFCSGRIIPDKRINWLIQSFSKIKNKQIELIISGQVEEKQKESLLKLAKELNITDRIKFVGVVPFEDLVELNSNAKVYVFPTPNEDFGLVPAEAISCGTPVILWGDGSGPNEIIINELNGLYANPYDIEDYAKKIDLAINRVWDRKNILESSKKFSEKEIKKEFLNEIRKIISFANPK
jgi:glycosyltransferase involved in cell wall biosynthesis